jgi:hypothetical protein
MKKILDILAIVIPLLLLLLPLFRRIFFGKTKKVDGVIAYQPWFFRFSRTLLIVVLLLIGIIQYLFFRDGTSRYFGPKTEPLTVSKHSSAFNESLQNVLNAYYDMTDAFAVSDTVAIHTTATKLKDAFENFNIEELKKDSTIYLTVIDPVNNAKVELESILQDPSIDEKRGSLNILSDNLRNLLVVVKYDLAKVYWQECDQAFGEDKPGNWLSRSADSKNPYSLKNNQPCGSVRDTLNYMAPDSTKN